MQALSNLKILDFTTLLPGPYASLGLADMGAQVLKISSSSRRDLVLDNGPLIEENGVTANQAWLNRNKDTMFLNLKNDKAKEVIEKLIVEEGYNIIIEQFRPGVMERLGLGYENLKEIDPSIIYCSITGYGQYGEMSHKAGHDINFVARSGIMSHSGRKDGGPSLTGMQIGDLAVGSMNSIIGILAALNYRNMTGEGQYIDVSMSDGLVPFNSLDGSNFLVSGQMPEREGELLNGGSLYDYYETKDQEYISIGSLEPKFFRGLCELIDRPNWIEEGMDPLDISRRKKDLEEIIKTRTKAQWEEIFKDEDLCIEPVLNLDELLNKDQHIKDRELVIEMDLEDGKKVRQFAMPIKFSKSKPQYKFIGKKLGLDTISIMENLGYNREEIEKLKEDGLFD